jgi:hypothetical protein
MMGTKKILEDGSEIHYTDKGEFWYFIPKEQLDILKELNKEREKKLAEILWGKSKS